MDKNCKQIGFACALGAFIGSVIALELKKLYPINPLGILIGAIVGGLIGYLTYQPKEVFQVAKKVWRETTDHDTIIRNAQISNISLEVGVSYAILWVIWTMWAYLIILPPIIITTCLQNGENIIQTIGLVFLLLLFFEFILFYLVTIVATMFSIQDLRGYLPEDLKYIISSKKEETSTRFNFAKHTNQFYVSFVLLVLILKPCFRIKNWQKLAKILLKTPGFIVEINKWIWRFISDIFVYIHSTKRVLCFCDSALGTIVGYYLGDAIIGSIIGCIFGLISYQVVSIKLLKLQSTKQ